MDWVRAHKGLTALGVIAVLIIIGVASGGSSNDKSSSDQSASETTTTETKSSGAEKSKGCGIRASSDCTPHVGPNGKVRVDALIWEVPSAQTAQSIGDQTYGLGAEADGVFVVVNLKVHSDKNESATLTDDVVALEGGGVKYSPDSDGTTAAIGAGEKPLFLEDIGPDVTLQSKVVFDVPKSFLSKTIEVRFNELGFGDGHGYIRLPTPTAR